MMWFAAQGSVIEGTMAVASLLPAGPFSGCNAAYITPGGMAGDLAPSRW